ncbi:MAG: tetratricopeptide repeat protein [Planctomycetaceae bacterium]|nr:tetratricopeptide repeat protein [Planctomycetaceae bacterium]
MRAYSTRHLSCLATIALLAVGCSQEKPEQLSADRTAAGSTAPAPVIATVPELPPELAKLVESGDVPAMIAGLTEALEKSPNSVSILAARSTLYLRTGVQDLALADLDRAIRVSPDIARLHNNRGFLLISMNRHAEARAALERSLALDPQAASTHNNLGLLLLAEGRVQEAVPIFSRAIDLDDSYVDAYNNRGFCQMQLGLIDKALGDFNAALRLKPGYVNSINNRGLLKLMAGDLDAAILDFTEAMLKDPLNPKYYVHRRQAYLTMGDAAKAKEDARKIQWLQQLQVHNAAVGRDPNSVKALLARAEHFESAGDRDSAEVDLARAQMLEPASTAVRLSRARFALSENNFQKVVDLCGEILKQQDSADARSLRGDALLKLGRYNEAIADYDAVGRFDPFVAEAYWRRGKQHAQNGASEEANADLARAQELDPAVDSRLR